MDFYSTIIIVSCEAGFVIFPKARSNRSAAKIVKLFCSEPANRVSYQAIQTLGGSGLMEDAVVERFWRDARLLTIGEGTSEIQKLVIARSL